MTCRNILKEIDLQFRVKNPFKARMACAFVLFGLGDMTNQFFIEKV